MGGTATWAYWVFPLSSCILSILVFAIVDSLPAVAALPEPKLATPEASMWTFVTSWPVVALIGPSLVLLGFGVLSMTPPAVNFSQGCFAVGYFIILAKIASWITFERTESLLERAGFIAIAFVSVGLLWFFSAQFSLTKLPAKSESEAFIKPSVGLTLNLSLVPIVVSVPPKTTIYFVTVRAGDRATWGLQEFGNGASTEGEWNPLGQVHGKMMRTIGLVKCEVDNHSAVPLLSTEIEFSFAPIYGQPITIYPVPNHTVRLPPIDPYGHFSFYFVNDNPFGVTINAPRNARIQVVGEFEDREAPIHLVITDQASKMLGGGMILSPLSPPTKHDGKAAK